MDISDYKREIARRRTFAIISHPDAGKTTLTEKLLLYAQAIDLAGAVKAKKNQRSATSDWMELERQRGISITSTVLQFPYEGYHVNLLDTPGHQDFSEDTYRTLTAADSAVMLMDAAKGVEPQTRKLFGVCRRRAIPIFTFYNKMDRPSREPLELLSEIEDVLGIRAVPMNWPLGSGDQFVGVYDLGTQEMHRFERTEHGGGVAPVQVTGVDDPALAQLTDAVTYRQFRDEIELVSMAGEVYDQAKVDAGELTPVYFGSARTNFGVELFFRSFLRRAPQPAPLEDYGGGTPHFAGFVFKIQANMDPQHRDCVAFVRVANGHFEREMTVLHPRSGRRVRLSRAMKLFAQDRVSVEEGYPGDVVGLINPGLFAIGDVICDGPPVQLETIPRFPPEHFAVLRSPDPSRRKSFLKGLSQLAQEGAIQVLYSRTEARDPILAVVGRLQFEVCTHRLKSEYGVDTVLEPLAHTVLRWVTGSSADIEAMLRLSSVRAVVDEQDRPAALMEGEWALNFVRERYPQLTFHELPPE
jgi:peptide chain release factor 3